MRVREKLLALLDGQRGQYISGQQLAAELSVSRTAIWKAVRALREDGLQIDAVPNRGYCLRQEEDVLSAPAIMGALTGAASTLRVEVHGVVTSTNDVVRERALAGEPEGLVIVAQGQTAGRGRKAHRYHSPEGTGLYLTLLLRPSCSAGDSLYLTTAAAAAAALAIEAVSGRSAQIKWVNDVLVDGRKVCGILTEGALSMETGGLDYAAVGIGINVVEPADGFPPELAQIAGAIMPRGAARGGVRSRLAAQVLNRFMEYYVHLSERPFFEDYRARSFVIGRQVTVLAGGQSRPALVLGLDARCRLLVRYADGTQEALGSGEVSLRL